MQVYRKRYRKGGRYHSFVQLRLNSEQIAYLSKAKLLDMKVMTRPGSLIGKGLANVGALHTFNAQVSRIRSRWSAAIVRTSGSVFFDLLIGSMKVFFSFLKLFFRVFFGRRRTVSKLIKGIHVSSKPVEDVKEAEIFIFVSIAALQEAIAFAQNSSREDLFNGRDYRSEIPGLLFAGAGLLSEHEPTAKGSGLGPDLQHLIDVSENDFDEDNADDDIDKGEVVDFG